MGNTSYGYENQFRPDYIDTAECVASRSLTIGPDVYIESGADVGFSAPVVTLKPPFIVNQGAIFRVSTFPYTVPADTLEWISVDVSLNGTQGDAHVISKNE